MTWDGPFNPHMIRLLRHVARRGGAVLDGGCGKAATSAWLARRGCSVLGVDRELGTPPGIVVEQVGEWSGRLRLLRDDLFTVRLDETFDAVALFGVLHYAGSAGHVALLLDRVRAWLRPSGVAALSWICDEIPLEGREAFLPPAALVERCMSKRFAAVDQWRARVRHAHDGLPLHDHSLVYAVWRLRA